MNQTNSRPFEIALDIGHSSIGWAVFENRDQFNLLGTGVVLFPAGGCLAIKRRAYRRQRRHVRATRQRIERLKLLLKQVGALTEAELDQPGCAWPWKLAAEVLSGSGRQLTWVELWDVLRWYAHNRGYDGNARWSKEEDGEDTEKVENANELMRDHATSTMAATFCAALKISPLEVKKSSRERFKGLNAAFARQTVYGEVKIILEKQAVALPQLTPELIRALVGNDPYQSGEWDDDAWGAIPVPEVSAKLPKRYKGSYLFGQSIPRFDNRIISACPITYARIFDEELAATGESKLAAKKAARDSKVPAKKCREFLTYRWAMVLANLTVNDGGGMRFLNPEERKAIHQVMLHGNREIDSKPGHLTKVQLKKAVKLSTKAPVSNIDTYFLTTRAEDALNLREVPKSGRAPYTREVMKKAIREVFEGKHPMEKGNSLYLSDEIKEAQLQRTLEEKTNNHLVRHRVLITRRLVREIIKTFASSDAAQIGRITLEVNRDLQAFSGMTNKEIEGELNQMLKDHGNVVKKLEKDFAEAGKKYRITAGLIRKARIAEDMGWTCPYSQKRYGALELASGAYDKDHIVPRSIRPSDSLESLVITSKAINSMKGNRTAFQFMREFEGRDIEGEPSVGKQKSNLSSLANFRQFVDKLNTKAFHRQDSDRKKKRKALLLLEKYEGKGFLPKDLTQTSHLVRLAATELEKEFDGLEDKPRIVSLPGSVTGEVRKGWKLYGCLAAHNPEVQKLLDRAETEELNVKKELRDLTHLHHALDACVIGLTSHFIPNEGNLWQILVNRNRKSDEVEMLVSREIFSRDKEGRARLRELGPRLKQQITDRLGECRVVQHVPKRMDGLIGLEENTRGIVAIEVPDPEAKSGKLKEIWNNDSKLPLPELEKLDGVVIKLRRFGPRDPKNRDKRERQETYEKATKLLGLRPNQGEGKLRAIKGVRVVDANFGMALWRKDDKADGEQMMRIILWHKVWPQLNDIAQKENGGKWPQVLRNGYIISVPRGNYRGVWKVASAKANLAVDLMFPEKVVMESKGFGQKREVRIKTLLENGMVIAPQTLVGAFPCPTTS